MAIAVEAAFRGQGATLENYFKSIEIMGAAPEGRHPDPGCLFHWVTETGGGFDVTDVWQTREQFEQSRERRLDLLASNWECPSRRSSSSTLPPS